MQEMGDIGSFSGRSRKVYLHARDCVAPVMSRRGREMFVEDPMAAYLAWDISKHGPLTLVPSCLLVSEEHFMLHLFIC